MTRALPLGLALAAAAATLCAQDPPPDDFKPLFNGKDFTGFQFVLREGGDPANTWRVKDGVILCTGQPFGYFYTEKSYKNYALRYDWRFARPADLKDDNVFPGRGGLLVHIQGEPVVWPTCVEVQGAYRDHGNIFGMGVEFKQTRYEKEVRQKVMLPVGEWNTTEVICRKGQVTSKLNGEVICEGASNLTEGPIGWQSEGAEVHFRNIQIRELK